ncbi:MAG TPA: hypothetical protein VMA72_14310 [Streptosporangiaceae bacterium]|nr:hypothetical protein [Streptosporangiaceae bacterium]
MISRRFTRKAVAAAAVSAGAIAAAATVALAMPAGASTTSAASHGYTFKTVINHRDVTFNQLLGINQAGLIAGYFGSGATGHPNKGYTVKAPYHQGNFKNENFPHSAQTQVTGLNDIGYTVGFWVNKAGANFGFYKHNGQFHKVDFPGVPNSSPQMDQLLGVNDNRIAVGFYANAASPAANDRGFEYNIKTHKFSRIIQPGVGHLNLKTPSLTAAAINNHNTVAGFYTTKSGVTDGFIKRASGQFVKLAYPGASMTQAFGINDSGLVVGAYTTGSGSSAQTWGFTWKSGHFHKVNDPHGIGSTIINGVNDRGDLVGFYMDAANNNNTDGFVAKP